MAEDWQAVGRQFCKTLAILAFVLVLEEKKAQAVALILPINSSQTSKYDKKGTSQSFLMNQNPIW